jgi:phosphoribosylglycinamide formyltransferase-1
MQAIIDAIEAKKLNARISVLISNKEDSYALVRAKNHNIDAVFIDSKNKEREEFDKEINSVLKKNNVDLIILIGYMRWLSEWFVKEWKNKIINIHPSLLPNFAGGMDKDVHEEVLNSNVKKTGCTLHFVDESKDNGPIILQKEVNIDDNETIETLKEKVQKAEQEIILRGIKLFDEGKIKVDGGKVRILE